MALRATRTAVVAFLYCDTDPPPAWYIVTVALLSAFAFLTGCLLAGLL
jgi:hypothetical protein